MNQYVFVLILFFDSLNIFQLFELYILNGSFVYLRSFGKHGVTKCS